MCNREEGYTFEEEYLKEDKLCEECAYYREERGDIFYCTSKGLFLEDEVVDSYHNCLKYKTIEEDGYKPTKYYII